MRRFSAAMLAAILLTSTAPSAAGAQVTGRNGLIGSIFFAEAENYAIRVTLLKSGADQLSDCPGDFAYVNKAADNYDAYVAGLMTSYASNKPIALYFAHDANGYCKISNLSF